MDFIKEKKIARDQIRWTLGRLADALDRPEIAELRVYLEFNNRFTRRMGSAKWTGPKSGRVRLSAPLWPRASETERRETVIHEACHVVQFHIYPRGKGHGAEWKHLMRLCGVKPERCHHVDRTGIAKKQRRVEAACDCGTIKDISIRKAKQIEFFAEMGSDAGYICGQCRSDIWLKERV